MKVLYKCVFDAERGVYKVVNVKTLQTQSVWNEQQKAMVVVADLNRILGKKLKSKKLMS